VFLNYILHWGALRFYALLKGALTEKSLRKAALDHNGSTMVTWLLPEFSVNNGEALCPKLWKSLSMAEERVRLTYINLQSTKYN